jgi:hypothetical protein
MSLRNIILGLSFCFIILKLLALITISWWFLPIIWAIIYKVVIRAAFGSLFLVYLSSNDVKLRNEIGLKLEGYVYRQCGIKCCFTVEDKPINEELEDEE